MGCVESHPEGSSSVNTFQVVNINEHGQRQRAARLEVTETHLVLHQKGRTPICWPLRCLRRYGFDAEQFSFESGRRSPSGPGIYTFKCRRAEHLFNLLQYRIQNIAEDPNSRDLWPISSLREMRNSIQLDTRRPDGIEDSQGYLSPFFRPQEGTTVPTVPNPPILGSSGANGGVGGVVTFPSIASNPRSLPLPSSQAIPDGVYINESSTTSNREDEEEESTDHNAELPRSNPLAEASGAISSERPSSYSSSGSERPAFVLNHINGGSISLRANTIQLHHFKGFAEVPQSLHNETPMSLSYENIEGAKDFSKHDDFKGFKDPPIYMNVDTYSSRDPDHIYVNVTTNSEITLPLVNPRSSRIIGSAGSGSSHSGTTTTTDTDQPHMNYIQVDVEKGSDSSQTAPLSPQGSVGSVIQELPVRIIPSSYATIDIDKTEALRETAKAAAMEMRGEGIARRTRHNSHTGPLPSLGRHLSLL